MPLPSPVSGMVITYAYRWTSEHRRGHEEGVKGRPCAVLLAIKNQANEYQVIVLPITHRPLRDPATAIEIPPPTKSRLGLDAARSWIILSEANRFVWPGPDLRAKRAGGPLDVFYGELPASLYRKARDRWLALARARGSIVSRAE